MPVAGAGGFLSSLFFPGLDDRLAQHITPNPNPLAQQGGPAAPGSVDQPRQSKPVWTPSWLEFGPSCRHRSGSC